MKTYTNPKKEQWPSLATRPTLNQENLNDLISEIFDAVKSNGDQALKDYSLQFDKCELNQLMVSKTEIESAEDSVSQELKEAILLAKSNIEIFHASQQMSKQTIETQPGVSCWREARAIERIGIYIPGGSAPLFSTILMLAVPARLAGCDEIIMCTPPNNDGGVDPAILYTAKITGVTKIFKVGGAQAIAAMGMGTESIPSVFKIFGPGNQYVTKAKERIQELGIAIDMPAGPSEVLVIADDTCNPEFVAADLLSQAEHGADSQVILLSNDIDCIKQSLNAIERQLNDLSRKDIAQKALQNSKAVLFSNLEQCFEFSNIYAPEHLIIASDKAEWYLSLIQNAGSVFVGNYSCESAGDYASGTNHTLPTNGFAKNYSGVSLDSFCKKITFQKLSEEGIKNIGPAIELMAEAEQLQAHKNAITLRLNSIEQ